MLYMQQPQQSTVYSKDEDLPPPYSSSVIEARCLKTCYTSGQKWKIHTFNSRTNKNVDDLSQHLSPPPSYRRARELSECSGDVFYPQNLKDIEFDIIEDDEEDEQSEHCVNINSDMQFQQIEIV